MAAAAWQPTQDGVLQLVNLLTLYQQPGTNQSKVFQQLEGYRAYPDFNNYLAFIFATGEQLPVEGALLPLLGHVNRQLRHTSGTIASVITGLGGLDEWPELAAALPHCLQAEDANVLDGALDTLYKILEDHPSQIEVELAGAGGALASSLLVPPLLQLMRSPVDDVRCMAVACLNLMAPHMPKGLQDNVDGYLQGLFALANDSSNRVRKEVVSGLVASTTTLADKLVPFMAQLVEYMLASNEHSDPAVALAAAEFWTAYLDLQLDPGLLRPYLARLIPVLLKNMVFDEYDDEVAEAEAAESAPTQKEDRDQDVKPFMPRTREHGPSAGEADGGDDAAGGDNGADDDDEMFSAWNLRKCSAEALDMLSNNFGDDLLPVLLPIVQQRLQDTNWRSRESAILALGAVCHGCHAGLQPYLEGMIHMLLPALQDARPMVRIITCWTLGRYSHWLFQGVVDRGQAGRPLLNEVMAGVLRSMGDNNKFVQAAAVSSLAVIVEAAGEGHQNPDNLLEPYTKAILEALAAALTRYTRRGVVVTYDALACTARVLGSRMSDPAIAGIVLPPLVHKFTSAPLADKDLLATMECLANVTPHIGRAMEVYAKALYDKAIALAGAYIHAGQQQQQPGAEATASTAAAAGGATANGGGIEYDPNYVVLALDVLSGLAQGLRASIESLVAASPLVQMLLICCSDQSPDIRQSAFALIGDLASACVAHLLPVLEPLVSCSLTMLELPRITDANLAAANNACWSLGEVIVKVDTQRIVPHAEAIAHRVASILSYTGPGRMPPSILENCSITLGRTAWRCADQLAPHLGHFALPWCTQLRNIRDGTEKEHAFLGLCRLVRMNPEAALPAFPMLCSAFASWRRVGCEGLRNEMAQILQLYKANLVALGRWEVVFGDVPDAVRGKLVQMFGQAL
ncbi:hypothetical protein VOLCADRAFT_107966 [Volvox carteri f. nagariensis]|uniref:Importin N-terminal domain-containing protein n=1 Tax=Volvox carteri f. nagariensis TaxID=3068 RepID=D8UHH9_VOLCA|nr:uncharacterized protein VOLCADRAFT_107966 [Volvox carteri f. nagariensis]EFJ40829.1 hypothetical protein VOLCADRAFT_107966 [Volvox carteri f. nagariensis]|eukprot:XP_002958098.1 hypothetical protein VOLCADRAFT_107966 [Volvox carteri f. nagariensis]